MRIYLILAITISGAVHAQDRPFQSYGSLNCGDFMAQPDNAFTNAAAGNYVRGLMTGYNMATSKTQVTTPLTDNTVSLWMQKYCRENPLNGIREGALKLHWELTSPTAKKQ